MQWAAKGSGLKGVEVGTIVSCRYPLVMAGAAVLALAGCAPQKSASASDVKAPAAEKTAAAAAPDKVEPAVAAPTAPDKGDVAADEKTDGYTYHYSYPALVNGLPVLRQRLEDEGKAARAELVKWAADGQAGAKSDNRPFNPYDMSSTWSVVADLPDWLSLSNKSYSFTGGAHGNTSYDGILWDKKANRERKPDTLFLSTAAMDKALRPTLCDKLDAERSKRREEKVVRNPDDWASACIALKDTTIIFGSSNRQTFNRIGFIMAPYSAGPYVEGTYEVTLPVTPAVLAVIKPEFRSAFSVGR